MQKSNCILRNRNLLHFEEQIETQISKVLAPNVSAIYSVLLLFLLFYSILLLFLYYLVVVYYCFTYFSCLLLGFNHACLHVCHFKLLINMVTESQVGPTNPKVLAPTVFALCFCFIAIYAVCFCFI
ncbi:hypothetical protein Ancab_025033 [Ancistrocladus abbreviatus]